MLDQVVDDLLWLGANAREPIIRTRRSFMEEEIVIPDGPYKGERYRCDRQPYTAALFAGVDSERWPRSVFTGPTQSGKTLSCLIGPVCYHLFEVRENVISGLPSLDISGDKWSVDMKPVIEASRYRDLLPRRGAGSRDGGNPTLIRFRNGACLRFMTGGGGDKSRAGFTSRVVAITETDGMDESSETSREADKITQLEARTKAFGSRARIYMECTVSIEQGRTWRELLAGTNSRLHIPCPHCLAFVAPEREHLFGWQDTEEEVVENVVQARERAFFACPECGGRFTEEERVAAVHQGRLLHSGETLRRTRGGGYVLEGEPKSTDTFSFRWSAFENLFATTGDLGVSEWKASQAEDEDNAEREQLQFVWAKPYLPPKIDTTPLDRKVINKRRDKTPHGIIPPGTTQFTIGIDVGKWLCHWVSFAWRQEIGVGNIVDYGKIEVPSKDMDEIRALVVSLRDFMEVARRGWATAEDMTATMVPDQVWIDSGYMGPAVYEVVRDEPDLIRPTKGYSAIRKFGRAQSAYLSPSKRTKTIKHIGEGYDIRWRKEERINLVHVNADHWKTWAHRRFSTPTVDDRGGPYPGSVQLYESKDVNEHLEFAASLTSEKMIEEFKPERGTIARWVVVKQNKNHFLDATALAMAASHMAGARLLGKPPEAPKPPPAAADTDRAWIGGRGGRRTTGGRWVG